MQQYKKIIYILYADILILIFHRCVPYDTQFILRKMHFFVRYSCGEWNCHRDQ